MAAAGLRDGRLFRSIDRHGWLGAALSAQSVTLVVKPHAERVGPDPRHFAGHSLRAGFLTRAAEAGADVLRMMEVSRHRRVETVQGYVRRANGFKGTRASGSSDRELAHRNDRDLHLVHPSIRFEADGGVSGKGSASQQVEQGAQRRGFVQGEVAACVEIGPAPDRPGRRRLFDPRQAQGQDIVELHCPSPVYGP